MVGIHIVIVHVHIIVVIVGQIGRDQGCLGLDVIAQAFWGWGLIGRGALTIVKLLLLQMMLLLLLLSVLSGVAGLFALSIASLVLGFAGALRKKKEWSENGLE